MRKNNWKLKETLALVKKSRPFVCPNKGFQRQLKRFESNLNNVPEEKRDISEKVIPGKERDYLRKLKVGKKV